MSSFDAIKFAKILALGESSSDGEALAAVRLAAKMARGSGMSLGEAVEKLASNGGAFSSEPIGSLKSLTNLMKSYHARTEVAEERVAILERQLQQARELLTAAGKGADDPAFLTNTQLINRIRDLRQARGAAMPHCLISPDCMGKKERAYAEDLLRREMAGQPEAPAPAKGNRSKRAKALPPGGAS